MSQRSLSPDTRLPTLLGWTLAIALSVGLLLLLSALLVSLRLEKALTDLLSTRSELLVRQVADAAESGLRFGVTLGDQPALPHQMTTMTRNDTRIRHLAVLDEQARSIHAQPPGTLDSTTVMPWSPPRTPAQTSPLSRLDPAGLHTLVPIRDATGRSVGSVWMLYATDEAHSAFRHSLIRLSLWALGLTVLVTLCLVTGLAIWMRRVNRVLDAASRGHAPLDDRWAILPLPQAWQRLNQLERELDQATVHAARERSA